MYTERERREGDIVLLGWQRSIREGRNKKIAQVRERGRISLSQLQ